MQASARSPAVLMFILTGVDVGALVGAAAYVGEAKTTATQKIRTNRIAHLFLRTSVRARYIARSIRAFARRAGTAWHDVAPNLTEGKAQLREYGMPLRGSVARPTSRR